LAIAALSGDLVMTTDYSALTQVFAHVPSDLVEYFDRIADGSFASRFEIALNLLPPPRAVDLTAKFRQFAIIEALKGFVLDDGNTSNHHFYVAGSPLQGTVLFLAHDGDSRIVYPSLNEFVSAARAAKEQDLWFPDIHPAHSPVAPDQTALSQFIRQHLGSENGTEIVTAIIPSIDLRDITLLRRLAEDDDFFLGEAWHGRSPNDRRLSFARSSSCAWRITTPKWSMRGGSHATRWPSSTERTRGFRCAPRAIRASPERAAGRRTR
jgi:hypothetical protein